MADNNLIQRRGSSGWLKVLDGDDYVLISNYTTDQDLLYNATTGYISGTDADTLADLAARVAALEAEVDALQDQATNGGSVPIGTIIFWAGAKTGATVPTGYLVCDGTAQSRTTYANLFAEISDKYGVGDGSTTFNMPTGDQLVAMGIAINANTRAANSAASSIQTGNHTHSNTASSVADNATHAHGDNIAVVSGNANHGHTDNFANANQSAGHTHNYGYGNPGTAKATSGISTNHAHTVNGSVTAANAAHGHNVTGTVSNANANHAHTINMTNNTQVGDHTHTQGVITGTYLIKY